MKRLMISGIIGCLVMLLAPAAFAGDPQGPPGGLGVEIVNPLPLPVTGDVNATITGNVSVSGTSDVNVVNIPEVTVINTKEPIILFEQVRAKPGSAAPAKLREAAVGASDPFVVPDNTQLVIEYVSMATLASRLLTPGEDYQGFISDNAFNRFLVGTVRGEDDVHESGPDSGQMVTLRFKPGSFVNFAIFSKVDTLVNIAVSGYLETIE